MCSSDLPEEEPEPPRTIPINKSRILDDTGKPVPTDRGNRLLGWLRELEERRRTNHLYRSLIDWAKGKGYRDKINEWVDDDPRVREAAEFLMSKVHELPSLEPEDDNQDPDPPPPSRRSAPPPEENGDAGEKAFVVDAGDPLAKLKKQVVGLAKPAYFRLHEEPPSDRELRDFLNDLVMQGSPDGPKFALPAGINGYKSEKWLEYILSELKADNAKANKKSFANNGYATEEA